MNKNYWICDIETKALAESVQREIAPEFEAPKNIKDPEKVKAAIIEKERSWLESAALEATRGEVLAVGLLIDGQATILHGVEADILLEVRQRATINLDRTLVGHNLLNFDIPFLCRRMWKHGIIPPPWWLDCTPYKAKWAFDTLLAWSCGNRDQRVSLDVLAWHLGVGRKNGNGKDFAALYETDQQKALDYLRNDLELTEKCYLKMVKE